MSEPMYKVNLLPPKLQREEVVDISRLFLIAVITFFSVIILGAGAFFIVNYFTMRNDIAAATQRVSTLQPTVAYVTNLRKERTAMEKTVTDYKALLNKQITWSSLLYELNDIAPVDVWLVELDIQNVALPAGTPGVVSVKPATAAAKKPAGKAALQNTEPIPRPNTVTIKGYSRSVPEIGIFVQNLKQLPYFKNVLINKINSDTTGNSFDITAYIKDELNG